MTKIIFSFDEEDYITPEADEAVKFWAKTLCDRGISGSFNLVGERARGLRERGKKDIIKLLRAHEINYHSNFHSLHPTFPEYLEKIDWDKGVEEVIKREIKGINDLREIFGQSPYAFMQPGNSGTAQTVYAMVLMGIPVMEWNFFDPFPKGQPVWYCNSFNGLTWNFVFDSYFETENRLAKMKDEFNKLYGKYSVIVLGTHPCKLVTSKFWDGVNFSSGKNTPREKWQPAPLRSEKFIKELCGDIVDFIDWLRKKPDLQFATYGKLYNLYKPQENRWLSLKDLLQLAKRIKGNLNYQILNKNSFSPAEIFSLLVWTLTYFADHRALPNQIPFRPTIGPISDLPSFKGTMNVNADVFLAKCAETNQYLAEFARVPAVIKIRETKIGPGDFTNSLAEIILKIGQSKKCPAKIIISESGNYPTIVKDNFILNYDNQWLFTPGFKGKKSLKLAELQAWSIKPAVLK